MNLSVSDALLFRIRKLYPSVPKDKDEAYLKCAANVIRYEAVLRYFFDGSPTDLNGKMIDGDSFRNSDEGYRCDKAKLLDYSSRRAYLDSLKMTELYERMSGVRVKSLDKIQRPDALERVEFRLCDIDPFDICGISVNELKLAVSVIFLCMVSDAIPDDPMKVLTACLDVNKTLCLGLEEGILYAIEQEKTGVRKSDRVRAFIRENGLEGFCDLALRYAKESETERG